MPLEGNNLTPGRRKIWEDMGRYGKIWEDMGRYGKMDISCDAENDHDKHNITMT